MTERIDVTPRFITCKEAKNLTIPVDNFPVEPAAWAEAWHQEADKVAGRTGQRRGIEPGSRKGGPVELGGK